MSRPVLRLVLAVAVLAAAVPPLSAADAGETAAGEVAAWLAGTFDSQDQAAKDPSGFRAVRLVAVLVPKSPIGRGAPVLYLEQAMTDTPNKPYRQRFYRIEDAGGGRVISRVFEPKDPIAVSGKWREPSDLAVFSASDVVERLGCAVHLEKKMNRWEGATLGTSCPSALSSARYATSQVSIGPDQMESWDRGYDAQGKQVWGATQGPYVFVKRSLGPPAEPSPR